MIRNVKESFPPKTEIWKKQVLQDLSYVNTVKVCMLAILYGSAVLCQCLHS